MADKMFRMKDSTEAEFLKPMACVAFLCFKAAFGKYQDLNQRRGYKLSANKG
jgi:hypothetical protein